MKLSSLLEKLEYTCVQGSTEQEVTGVVYDSRKVTDGSLFICIRGAVVDGHKFIPDVTAKGAKVLVVVVFPLVPVIPIVFSFSAGCPNQAAEINAIAYLVSVTWITVTSDGAETSSSTTRT